MKLRKIAAMTMAVAMLGGTLAGCGGAASSTASSSADSTPAESTSTAESTETSGEKVNIKLFTGKIETIDVMNESSMSSTLLRIISLLSKNIRKMPATSSRSNSPPTKYLTL